MNTEQHNSLSMSPAAGTPAQQENFGAFQPTDTAYPFVSQPDYAPMVGNNAMPASPMPPLNAWPGGSVPPGVPGAGSPAVGPQPAPRERSWKIYPIGALLLVVLLLGSFALGRSLVGSGASPSSGNSAASSTIVVPPSAQDLQQTLIEVAQKVQPSVVEVTSLSASGEGIGSGVILSSDGYIVTNDHVVSGFNSFTVTLSSGTREQAQLVGQDALDDLAVLKIAASNLTPITFADSSQVAVGEFALAIGSPLGLEGSTTLGIVSALNRTASETPNGPASELAGLIQTSAAINPGNSGGALVNLQGQLIGITTLGAVNTETNQLASDIGFAIPSNRVKYVVDQLIKNGQLTSTNQGFLGIQGQDVTPQLAAADGLSVQQGVLVQGFTNDAAGQSPAQQAGLQRGDVIIGVDNIAVSTNDDLAGALLTKTPGTRVTLVVERGANQITISVTLGERPITAQG